MAAEPGRRLKILLVAGKLTLGGLETHIYDLGRGLVGRGHDVLLHAPYVESNLLRRLRRAGVVFLERPESCGCDIVHAHPWTWGLLRGLELSVFMNKPLVVTYHGRYRVAWEELRRNHARVIAVSPEVRAYLGDGEVIENGIDTTWFTPDETVFLDGAVALGFVGRLDGDRWRAIQVLANVADRLGFRLHVAGDYNELQSKELLEHKRIVWHGRLVDVRPVLRASHFVFSTGRGIREAMASGRPAAVLNSALYDGLVTPDNVERLRHFNFSGRASRRAPSEELLAADIEALIQDKRHWTSLAGWSRQYAEKHFGLEAMVEKHEQVYLDCLENRENQRGNRLEEYGR